MIWFDILRGVVLGLIQGLTEFLPVSSSGHLILVPKFFGWEDQGLAFDTVLHLGTIAALVWFFGGELGAMAKRLRGTNSRRETLSFLLKIALATVPAVIIALFFNDWIEANARSSFIVAGNLALWGAVLFIADRKLAKHPAEAYMSVTFFQAFLLGLAQSLALIPGTSRSGVTIAAAMFLGFSRSASARLSFLMALPVTLLAGADGLWKIARDPADLNGTMLAAGFITAAVSGVLAIKFLLGYVSKHRYDAFVIYRLALALLVFASIAWATPVFAEEYMPIPDEFASAVVMRASTGKVLYSFKPGMPRVAASLTKLATGIAILKQKPNWNRVVRLSVKDEVGGGRLHVASGATLTMRDLLYSALTGSANNAAMALGRLSGLGPKNFAARMNSAAKTAGATHTILFEPSGMDPRNLTTAHDMALIARWAFREPLLKAASTVSAYDFYVRNTGELKIVKNTNKTLLDDPEVWLIGGKTGYLEESMYNLVAQMRPYDGKVSDPKLEVVIAVLGAPTKEESFESVKRLAKWAWAQPDLFKTTVVEQPFVKDLAYGSRDPSVRTLQTLLAQDQSLYPEGIVNGVFGPATRRAVERFQLREGIASSYGSRGYGRVGPATRAKLAQVFASR